MKARDTGSITEADVKRALGRIRATARVDDACPLRWLAVVDERLSASGARDSEEARSWILTELLLSTVREQLAQLGSASATTMPIRGPERSAERDAAIVADFQAGCMYREAWSCLYHRYLSPTPIRVNDLAALTQPCSKHGRRLISRRMALGYTLVANALRTLEQQARR